MKKKYKKIKAYRKSVQKEPTDKRCLLLTLIWVGFLGIRFEVAVVVVVVVGHWPKIWKLETHPSEFFPISGDWGDWDTKFYMNVSNKMLLNAAKCQGYCFYHFWIVKGKPTGGKITPYPPSQTHILKLGLIKSRLKVIQIIGQRAGNSCRHRHFCNA